MTDKKPSPQRTALLVHCHSEADSFVTTMRNTVAAQLEQQGYAILHSDLYAMNFNPVLSPADFPERTDPDHLVYALEQRNGFKTGSLAPDILAEVEKVEAADLIVFTFPLFWFSVPALLKGWIDRVFLSGPFYGGKRFYDQGGMKGKRALTAFSLGGHEGLFGTDGIHGDLETGMLRPFLQGALGYVGFDVLEPFVAYHVPYISVEERTGILQNLKDALQSLEERASLAMPSLASFSLVRQ